MKNVLLALLFTSSVSVFATVIEEGSKSVSADVSYVVVSVEATCRGPRYEDDSSTVYFSAASYTKVMAYKNRGFAMKTLSHYCGNPGPGEKRKELSADVYETVRVLLIDTNAAQKSIEDQIRTMIDSF